ncbi:MAG: outer membrane chaperone Skp [Acidaminococcus intestini]
MRKLICLLVACLMVTAGCASLKNGLLSREVPRFAVVDWDRLVKQHPKYKVWQKQKTDLETAKALRERQLKDGHQQLAILGKMRSLAGKGRDRFRSAQLAAKVAEKEAQEQDLLQKKAESLDAAAESYVQKDREDVETRFRIPLFNVRLKLGSIKMSEASQNALLQEEQELLDKRREAIEAIEEKKAAWIKEQMASDISESRARMDAFQQSLTVDLVKEETGLDLTKKNSNLDKKSLIRSLLPWILRSSVRTRRRRNCVRKSTVISSAPSRKSILPGSTPWFFGIRGPIYRPMTSRTTWKKKYKI